MHLASGLQTEEEENENEEEDDDVFPLAKPPVGHFWCSYRIKESNFDLILQDRRRLSARAIRRTQRQTSAD